MISLINYEPISVIALPSSKAQTAGGSERQKPKVLPLRAFEDGRRWEFRDPDLRLVRCD